jgi:hypothetical protein
LEFAQTGNRRKDGSQSSIKPPYPSNKLNLSKPLKQLQRTRLNPLALPSQKQVFPNGIPGYGPDFLRVVPDRVDSIVEALSAMRTYRAMVSKDYFLALGSREIWDQGIWLTGG